MGFLVYIQVREMKWRYVYTNDNILWYLYLYLYMWCIYAFIYHPISIFASPIYLFLFRIYLHAICNITIYSFTQQRFVFFFNFCGWAHLLTVLYLRHLSLAGGNSVHSPQNYTVRYRVGSSHKRSDSKTHLFRRYGVIPLIPVTLWQQFYQIWNRGTAIDAWLELQWAAAVAFCSKGRTRRCIEVAMYFTSRDSSNFCVSRHSSLREYKIRLGDEQIVERRKFRGRIRYCQWRLCG